MIGAWWKSALLGLVQGLTEFLPISSSGHLIAVKEVLQIEVGLALDVALHVATLGAVVIYFRRDLASLFRLPQRGRVLVAIALATVPGAGLGWVLSDWREDIASWWVVGGWCFSWLYLTASRGRGGEGRFADIAVGRALLIGCAQALAVFPGVSRSGSSIVSALWLGLEREQAFRFSFLLSVPLIAGAGAHKALGLHSAEIERLGGPWALALGMAVAFAVGLLALHLLLRVVRWDRFHLFGWYNLAAAATFAVYLATR